MRDEDNFSSPEAVYSAPQAALAAANETLADSHATNDDRANALLVLGKTAYYRNRMDEAVVDLRRAHEVAQNPALRAEVVIALAPALGKQGHHQEALDLLDPARLEAGPGTLGQLHNQRSIILSEIGRLYEATAEGELALPLLRQAGDVDRECRALVNLGAFASMMGELDTAEAWYSEALEIALATSQRVSAACVEGNLGYISSRRGRFADAIDWYEKARTSFADIGGVDLLVAVLELDYARTLLDIGLARDALGAGETATASAASGNNRMLEMQARIMCGEALIELGELTEARQELDAGRQLASQLSVHPWFLRSAELEARRQFLGGEGHPPLADPTSTFLIAGWAREAHAAGLNAALRLVERDPAAARELLQTVQSQTHGLDVDPIDHARADIVLATLQSDHERAYTSFVVAIERLTELRDLLGSVEMRAALSQRSGPLLAAMLPVALQSVTPGDRVFDVLERVRAATVITGRGANSRADPSMLTELRDSRVQLDEAKLNGTDVAGAQARVTEIEARLLQQRRTQRAEARTAPELAQRSDVAMPDDTAFVTYTTVADELLGVVHDAQGTALFELGDARSVRPLVRAQQATLRRFADQRRRHDSARSLVRLQQTNAALDDLLLGPLNLTANRVALAPSGQLGDLAWTALPTLRDRPVTLTHCLGHWVSEEQPIRIKRHAFLGGPGLMHTSVDQHHLSNLFGPSEDSRPNATCAEALQVLRSVDFAHVAAHGEFRSDNPFFSSILFDDDRLSILRLSELERVPQIVVLASCDGGAHVANRADVVVGTATELRQLGAKVVIAPSVAIGDAGASEFFGHVYDQLESGSSIDHAVLAARRAMANHEDLACRAAAFSIQTFGGQLTRHPLMTVG